MNLSDIRLQNLLALLDEAFGGRQVELAKRMGRSQAQIAQWKSGYRKIHEDSARSIERAGGKPRGWLDELHADNKGLSVQDAGAPVFLPPFRPSLRLALEVLCDELGRIAETERREGVGSLLRSCAISGGDATYIDAILSVMRQSPPKAAKHGLA
jgi:hypothetical protein